MQHQNDKLARPQNVNSAIEKSYSALSSAMLIRMLDRAMSMSGKEITDAESQLWKAQFAKYPPQVIQEAFDTHAMRSEFFPKPKEISEIIAELSRKATLAESELLMEENRKTRERLAEEGLPHGPAQFGGLMAKLKEVVKAIPAPELSSKRRNELKEKLSDLQKKKVG